MRAKRPLNTTAALALAMMLMVGCYNDPLDPTQIGRFEPTPAINVILDTLGVADEPTPVYEGAEDPKPEDLIELKTDYVFGPGDVVRISIFELYNEGQTYVNDYVVTETGRISIPDVGIVQAAGLTEPQLEQEIRNILSPTILKNPSVTATLLQSQSRYFSIVGQGVGQSARFPIPRYTFRLTDAIALAGGVAEFNVSYIYISRDISEQIQEPTYPAAQPAAQTTEAMPAEPTPILPEPTPILPAPTPAPEPQQPSEEQMLDMIAPAVVKRPSGLIITSSEMAFRRELEALAAPEGVEPPAEPETEQVQPDWPTRYGADPNTAATTPPSTRIEWVFENGQWRPKVVPIDQPPQSPAQQLEPTQPQMPAQRPQPALPTGLTDVGQAGKLTRVIKVPVDKLLGGDPRYNIIIRPGDRITVPVDLIGEFWVMGNVNAQGAVPITGRPITLKQAIATAGGLNPIAYPKKVEVVRRIGRNSAGLMQEETVLVDLQKIAKGQQPDFFIKPNDLINVGTHGSSRFQAVLRNAFRASYGFGFIYDRNFADRHFGETFAQTFRLD